MRSWLATTSAPLRWAALLSSSSFFWTSAIFWSTRAMRSRTTVRCSSICCAVVALSASSRWMRASIWRPLSTGTQQAEVTRRSETAIRFFIRARPALLRDDVVAAVLLPAGLGGLGADGALLAVADRLDRLGRDAQVHEELLGRLGATLSELEVVLDRAAI